MENFELLGALALKLHTELRNIYYLLLPVFFCLSLVITWLKTPTGGPEFIEAVKRAFVATLLLAGFQEITDTILFLTSGLADKISDMQGLDMFMQMAGEKAKSYTASPTSLVLGFNDLIIATLSFLSYIILYVARFLMVAVTGDAVLDPLDRLFARENAVETAPEPDKGTPASRGFQIRFILVKFGGGWPKVVEHQELTISRWYEIQWRRQEIDLTELAKRRWIDKWAIERLAEHFGFGPTRIKFFLNRIKDNPDLVSLELGSGKKRPWAVGRVFRGET